MELIPEWLLRWVCRWTAHHMHADYARRVPRWFWRLYFLITVKAEYELVERRRRAWRRGLRWPVDFPAKH